MKNPLVSIVVIGKNEANNILRIYSSLAPLKKALFCESIYVDSASSDNSFSIAKELFDKTIVLSDDQRLNASAGRYTGVQMISGDWILFLDADMELIPDCIIHLRKHVESSACIKEGAVGNYVNRYPDGSISKWVPTTDRFGIVNHFGGAVLLPNIALKLENWDPRLYSNEEIDLYTRLRSHGFHVRNLGVDFINHWTPRFSWRKKIVGNFYPVGGYLGKKYYGMGQLIVARLTSRRLSNLIRWWPEPFALWIIILLAPLLGVLVSWVLSFSLLAGVAFFVTRRYSWRSIVGFIAFLPQIIYGIRHFARDWFPKVSGVFQKDSDESIASMIVK